jgi:hypothetical protein
VPAQLPLAALILLPVPELPRRGLVHEPDDPARGGRDELGGEALGVPVRLLDEELVEALGVSPELPRSL